MEDTAVQNGLLESTTKQITILDSTYREYTTFENCSHTNGVFKGLQSLRENKVFCDIELETDDGAIVFGHKNVLVSASPYFHAMFTRFEESTKDHVVIKEIDSTILKLLVDFIYNGKITVTLENVQVLIPAANLLQLHYVEGVCCEFLQTQLQPSNCLGIKSFAELHSCMKLLSSSEAYIKKNFLEIVECDEFLSLPFEEVLKLISCDDLNVSSEEKVFECVINWVKHELSCRKDILPKLMEQMEDTAVQNGSPASTTKQITILDSTYREYTTFVNCSHINGVFKGLQSLRENKVFCDIELETNDGAIVFGHKNVLVSASPYFHAMFTRFEESTKDHVVIKEIDSTILKLLVDFIYNGKITVTLENVQVLIPAANLLQLHYVEGVCCEFLQTQLQPSNCLGIKSFAELHSCMELLSSSEAYIKKKFLEIVECDEFLSLPFEEVLELISCEDLNVSSEEKVFECVINWVKHELSCRKDILPKLMEQVRLPLVSKKYILKEVLKEPLLNESSKCKDYVIEALNFHLFKTEPLCNIPDNFRCKPRLGALKKVILAFYCFFDDKEDYEEIWHDPLTNKWHFAPKMNTCCLNAESEGIIVKDNFLFSFVSTKFVSMMYMLDLSVQSPLWILNIPMLLNRKDFGVGMIGNCIFVVGGAATDIFKKTSYYNEVEVYDLSIHEWKKVSSMTTKRKMVGVGVLNNFLYVVGGCEGSIIFNSVECYDPSLDTWSNVAEMSQRRYGAGVGVLNGVMYAVGGNDGSVDLKSAEIYRPCDGVWSTISDMNHPRNRPVVIAFNGLIYAMGGIKSRATLDQSIEIYNPNIGTWVIMGLDTNVTDYVQIYAGVVIDRPLHFKTH